MEESEETDCGKPLGELSCPLELVGVFTSEYEPFRMYSTLSAPTIGEREAGEAENLPHGEAGKEGRLPGPELMLVPLTYSQSDPAALSTEGGFVTVSRLVGEEAESSFPRALVSSIGRGGVPLSGTGLLVMVVGLAACFTCCAGADADAGETAAEKGGELAGNCKWVGHGLGFG